MRWLALLPLLFSLSSSTTSPKFTPPKYFYVIGEQQSGATYLSELIRSNASPSSLFDCALLHSHLDDSTSYHHQLHALHRRPDTHDIKLDSSKPPTVPRRSFVDKASLSMMQCPVEETLFILITKNPYSWIASLVESKHGVATARRQQVTDFVAGGWIARDSTERKIKNVMALRTAKLKSMMNLKVSFNEATFLAEASADKQEIVPGEGSTPV